MARRYDAGDLGLCMTLAGRDEWELVPGGAAVPLTRENTAQLRALLFLLLLFFSPFLFLRGRYVERSVDALLGSGQARVRACFARGWNRVFSLDALRLLTPAEISQCLCGDASNYSDEMWSVITYTL
jgi:hypothetical protein